MKKLLTILLICSAPFLVQSQEVNGHVLMAHVSNGDTLPQIYLGEILIFTKRIFKNEREKRRYTRMIQYIKKVYPYAKLAEHKLAHYDTLLSGVESDQQKRQLMREAEKEIKEEFYQDIRALTFTQGRILLKLIDRQTDHTSYELLKEYRGSIRALFWQGIARLFGANLKSEYDPNNDDRYIEEIVLMIENGMI